jgi:carbamoyltransferase
MNTSFNLAGDCIVETIPQAIDTLKKSKIDYVYFPEKNILVEKNV